MGRGELSCLTVLCVVVLGYSPGKAGKQASRGVSLIEPVDINHERGGVLYEVAQPALSPLGQHGHRTLTPRPEPPLVQLRAAHGVKAGDARGKWQGTLYHALYTTHMHAYVIV